MCRDCPAFRWQYPQWWGNTRSGIHSVFYEAWARHAFYRWGNGGPNVGGGGRWWAIHDVGGVMWRWRWCMVCTCKPFMIYETPWKSLRSNRVCHEKVLSWMYSFGFWFSASERTLRRSGRRQGITTSRSFGEWCGMPKCFQLFSLFNVKVFAPLYPCCA